MSSDITSLIRRQKQDGFGLLDSLSKPSHREVGQSPVELFGCVEEIHQERSLEGSRAERVEPNPFTGVNHGQFSCHGEHGTLGRRVGDLGRSGSHLANKRSRVDDATTYSQTLGLVGRVLCGSFS